MGSEQEIKLVCGPCDRNALRRASFGYCVDCEEGLCESCFSTHRNVKPCQKHTLLDATAMSEYQKLSSMPEGRSRHSDLKTPCPRHTKKMIEFYCHDHDTILCSVCVTLEHTRYSCSVKYIPDVSKAIVNSQEYKDTIRNTNTLLNQCQKEKSEMGKTIEDSNRSLTYALKKLQEHRREIQKLLDDLEKEAVNRIKIYQQENDARLKTTESIYDGIYKCLKSSRDTVEHLNSSEKASKLFVELKLAQELNKDNESSIANVTGIENITKYSYKPNENIRIFFKHEQSLGTFEPEEHDHLLPTTTLKPSYHGDICVQTSKDKMRCQITGMIHLSPDLLVLADHNNESIKMIDVKSQHITSQDTVSSEPWDICAVTNTEVAVTLPFKQIIQFISVTQKRLTQTQSLKVGGQCWGISCHQQNLVVTYFDLSKLQIMNFKGVVLNTVRTSSGGKNIFHKPYYVKVNSRSIYVSDYEAGASSVITLNWQGEVTGSFGDLDETEGLALTKDGIVYVCEWGKNRIRKISCDGTRGEVVVRELDRPQAVCWREKGGELYISSPLDEKYANFLKVYQIP